jgi:hypothetical protein
MIPKLGRLKWILILILVAFLPQVWRVFVWIIQVRSHLLLVLFVKCMLLNIVAILPETKTPEVKTSQLPLLGNSTTSINKAFVATPRFEESRDSSKMLDDEAFSDISCCFGEGRLTHYELAVMLTILEYEDAVLSIRPREFINSTWCKRDLKTVHPDLGGAATLSRYVYNTDKRVAWIAREIINYGLKSSGVSHVGFNGMPNANAFDSPSAHVSTTNKRHSGMSSTPANHRRSTSECIEYFLQVAYFALSLNNFNTVFQIVAALGKYFD